MIRTVHLFQCGAADLYGVTDDRTGANLPTDECAGGWRFVKTVELEQGLPPRGIDIAAQDHDAVVRAAIATNGFLISEGRGLPAEFK